MSIVESNVIDEIRDLLENDNAEITTTLHIYVLTGRAYEISESRFSRQFHHQVKSGTDLTYVRSSVRENEFEVYELGNPVVAKRVEIANSALVGTGKRLLVVPSRQVIALWHPETQLLSVVLPETSNPAPITTTEFERMLAGITPEIGSKAQSIEIVDHDTWDARASNERGAA